MRIETQASAPAATTRPGGAAGELLRAILAEAAAHGASHVHVEPEGKGAVVRLRVGGRLSDLRVLEREPAQTLARWVEAELAEDGVLALEAQEIAAAALPVRGGTRLVFRPDAAPDRGAGLEALGMRPQLAAGLDPTLHRGGLVLLAGPAGSGRSTTLAALLRLLAAEARSLIAIATRPLCPMPGLSQTVTTAGLPMATALAAALAQDADVIAVDEVADRATAARAVEAADAGHLVLATVAAPDAVGAVRRLRDWRVEPFQLASNLRLVLAQRLVRRLCPECRMPAQAQGSVSALLGFDPGAIVYSALGCPACDGSGYLGETGVFEAIEADAAIRRLINDGGDEAILARHAFLRAPNLGSAARRLVREGVTTPEEAVRLSRS
jgi:general secretion pathway protein E